MSFYKDTTPWTLNGEVVRVVDTNEHLCLQVSGGDEEQLNIDENIVRCRNSLFALLGPAYSYRCLLSPTVQIHLWTLSTPCKTSKVQIARNLPKENLERIPKAQQVVANTSFVLPTW